LRRKAVNPKKIYFSIFLETLALSSLKIGNFYLAILSFLFFHTGASAVLTSAAFPTLFSQFKKEKTILLTFFLSMFFFPVIGYIILFFFYRFALETQEKATLIKVESIPIEEIVVETVTVKPRKFGEGALSQATNRDIDEKTILFLKNIESPISIEVARKALQNPKDEVRLSAFSILEKTERKINERISYLKTELEKEKDPKKKAFLCRNIAFLYWELIYFGVVDKELEDFVANEALKFIRIALQELDDPEIHLVAGKIFLKRKCFKEAKKHLEKAFESGNRLTKLRIIPYLAEANFYLGNLEMVKNLLSQLPYSLHPNVYFIKVFWTGKDGAD
jgi:tetratricopeptide (TPR) repeat protein